MRDFITKYGYKRTCIGMVLAIVMGSLLVCGVLYLALSGLGFSINLHLTLVFGVLVPSIAAPFVIYPLLRLMSHINDLEIRMRELATYDGLTMLLNRRAFLERAQILLYQRKQSPSEHDSVILILDLDHFKRINDRFGHRCGDEVLKSFGKVAQGVLRKGDLIGRLGGEEFGIYLPHAIEENALAFAERLRTQIAESSTVLADCVISYTVSIGGTCLKSGDDLLEALNRADQALYHAKNSGRNRSVFWEDIQNQISFGEVGFDSVDTSVMTQ